MRFSQSYLGLVAIVLQGCHGQDDLTSMPTPSGSYGVGLNTTEMINKNLTQPFAPAVEPARLELSVFYPVASQDYTTISYMPPETARFEDLRHSQQYGLASPNGTFEKLGMQISTSGAQIASTSDGSSWPVLIFSPASGTTRLFYNYLVSNIASYGYVVLSFDTPYDTDFVQFSDGSFAVGNDSIQENGCDGTTAVTTRAKQASFILDQLKDKELLSSLIPGCDACLNLSQVGAFGHSVGGATATTLLGTEKRVVSALNYDGAIFGDIAQKGASKPYMIMAVTNQTIESMNTPDNLDSSWAAIWPKLTGGKYFTMLNNSAHYTYSDFPLALQTLNITTDAKIDEGEHITDLDGKKATEIITTYTLAFFNQTLRREQSDLLAGPSPSYPEITFDNYTATSSNDSSSAIYLCASSTSSSPSASSSANLARPKARVDGWNFIVAISVPIMYHIFTNIV